MQPITASKLRSDIEALSEDKYFQVPSVVKLHRFFPLCPPLPCMTFHHTRSPAPDAPTPPHTPTNLPSPGDPADVFPPDNTRYAHLTFRRAGAPEACAHGFAGYFKTWLYGDVVLSTVPEDHTPEMYSWFPIFFPLKTPVVVPAGADLELHMWRCCGPQSVWYEWAVGGALGSEIHNAKGKSYAIGL